MKLIIFHPHFTIAALRESQRTRHENGNGDGNAASDPAHPALPDPNEVSLSGASV